MRKIKKRFIASLVVFTSIISFLPVGLGGQAASAATSSDATTLRVNVAGQASELPSRIDSTSSEKIYTSKDPVGDAIGFDLTVKDVRTTLAELTKQAKTDLSKANSVTGIVKQRVEIKTVNGVDVTANLATLTAMGVTINSLTDGVLDPSQQPMIGKRILGLPYGINKIQYDVIVTNRTVSYTPAVVDSAGNITTPAILDDGTESDSQNASYKNLTIEHATDYANGQINKLQFKSYVGQTTDFSSSDEIVTEKLKNNEKPFLYYQIGQADANMPLRYNFGVPDSTFMLKYVMGFNQNLDSATIFRNGKEDTDVTITPDGSKAILEGSLERVGTSALIVIKVGGANGAISKAYSIEIKYTTVNANVDYSLSTAGITKYDFNEISSVEAYIGKKYTVTKNAAGFSEYTGDIYIDPKANLISIDPELICGKASVAYKLINNYVESGGSQAYVENSILKSDGKKYVDFKRGFINTLQLDVYSGQSGNITNSSTILARYNLRVTQITGVDSFTTDLKILKASSGDTIEPYLTQPGVPQDIIDNFTTDRRTYDLYYAPETTSVRVNFTGTRSAKNEYLKIWTSNDRTSTTLKEAAESKANLPDSSLVRLRNIPVNLGASEKMVVQAYYDVFQYDSNNVLKTDSSGNPVCLSYPLGEKYVFYIPRNFTTPGGNTGETSNNAALSSLKLKGYTLKDSDDNEGFSSDKLDYTTTVEKEDTSAKITAIAEDDNVKSITATINGAQETYDLVSGELSELPLSSTGKTTIKIVVTAQDGTTTNTYTVVVKNNTKGSNVNLKNVILNVGDYTFSSSNDITKVRVDQSVTSIKVTPVAEDSKATMTVNGQLFSQTPISVSLKGTQKTDISIAVKSEDGTASKTYTLEVYRVDVADWDNTTGSDDPTENDQFYDEYNESWVDLTKYDQWGTVNGKPAYFDKKSRQVKEQWITTGGKMYYLNNLGYRASGWKVDDKSGKTYYLDPTTGEMKKQWMNLDNKWYYLGLNGVMQKGWLNLNNKWYYFTSNGQMVLGQTMYIDGELCRFGQDGAKY